MRFRASLTASRVAAKMEAAGIPVWLYGLNPMAGVVEGFRWAALGAGSVTGTVIGTSAIVTAVLIVGGVFYFRRTERTFADII